MQRLVVCLDGTWNVRDDTTNIWRLHALVEELDKDHVRQQKYYDQGVGTRWYDRATGGVLGAGMYKDVREAYTWIAERYRRDDELFIFGFSRGAATALSLANLIDRCGIVGPESINTFEDAYRLYSMNGFYRNTRASQRFRASAVDHTARTTLKFLGLFDTVSSLYLNGMSGESVHVLSLPNTAHHVAHAIAIDENRSLFSSQRFQSAPLLGHLSERWFSGAHANVGGGYAFDPLAIPPLTWMMRQAAAHGLYFRTTPIVMAEELLQSPETDSFEEFAFGLLMLAPFIFKRRRLIGRSVAGSSEEWIDSSAISRYLRYATYRQRSIALASVLERPTRIDMGDFNVKQQ